jgi:carbonic anhydrase/acetyltransferase-like protein (isoleucine patch superfamily)
VLEAFEGLRPEVHPEAWVHPSAVVMGEVRLGPGASVWPGAVLRGDMGPIWIGAWTSVQDGAIAHNTGEVSVTRIGDRVTVGHRALLHGCEVEDDCLIGMGATLLDNCRIGRGSVVGAGALVPAGRIIPPGSVVLGSPGKVVRTAGPADAARIRQGWEAYRDLVRRWRQGGSGG